MSDVAISVQNLSKLYFLGGNKTADLRQTVMNFLGKKQKIEPFWALKNLSFEIQKGDILGIVGYNGAGKSTLLKILSRITQPTEGKIEINGRVSSLLEVGTGFHPELTGRENIFMNGSILGMKQQEIRQKFEEIVEFSGVKKFLDMPVKNYSSGMYARLAFSVAAHLDPEVLLVDEVLSVGDAEFQKKCIGKMKDVVNDTGRTIFFVSHNMNAIKSLCNKVLWLEKGQTKMLGDTETTLAAYLGETHSDLTYREWQEVETAPGNPIFKIHKLGVRAQGKDYNQPIFNTDAVQICIQYFIPKSIRCIDIVFLICDEEDNIIATLKTDHDYNTEMKGLYECICTLPPNLLNFKQFNVHVKFTQQKVKVANSLFPHLVAFSIVQNQQQAVKNFYKDIPGYLCLEPQWENVKL